MKLKKNVRIFKARDESPLWEKDSMWEECFDTPEAMSNKNNPGGPKLFLSLFENRGGWERYFTVVETVLAHDTKYGRLRLKELSKELEGFQQVRSELDKRENEVRSALGVVSKEN